MDRFCMFLHILFILLCFLGNLNVVKSLAPKFIGYNPLEGNGYKPKTQWEEFTPYRPVSAIVADFTHTEKSGGCLRVVMFTAKGYKLKHLEVPCDNQKLTEGLIPVDDVLWYYRMALAKQVTEENDKGQKPSVKYHLVVVTDAAKSTCQKTIVDESHISEDPRKDVTYAFDGTVTAYGPDADEDCRNLIQLNIPPMIMLSSTEGGRIHDIENVGPSTFFNTKDLVGAETKVYRNGLVCYRLVRFYSKGRLLRTVKMACGPMQGVVMTKRAFYYGSTVMMTIDNEDTDTFTMFVNRYNGRRVHGPEHSSDEEGYSKVCERKTFKLVKNGRRYNKKYISAVTEYEWSPECREFMEGKNQLDLKDAEKIYELADANVDQDVSEKLEGYKKAGKPSHFNLGTDLGLLSYYFIKKGNSKLKAIFVVSKGVVLTAAVLGTETVPRSVNITESFLIYDKDLVARREQNGEITVTIKDSPTSCTKKTYVLNESNGRFTKEEKMKETVDNKNADCQALL